jgi:hypothetical protein
MTDHPTPLGDKEHWAIDQHGTLHAPGPNATSPCDADTDRAVSYRQLTGSRADWVICDDCREQMSESDE